VHRLLRGRDVRQQHIEECAILEYLDAVALGRAAERKAGEGRNQRVDGGVALHAQFRITVALDRPDHHNQKNDDADHDQERHAGNRHGAAESVHLASHWFSTELLLHGNA
jgi:hypothetical protein